MSKWYACVDWNVCRSFEYTPSGGGGTVSIQSSVGLNGINRPADVVEIQKALNRVPAVEGGAHPQLTVDGLCGPLTRGAIRTFQGKQFPGIQPDSRVDPKQRTIGRINEILSAQPASSASSAQSDGSARSNLVAAPKAAPDSEKPEIQKAFATIPECLTLVRSAIHRLEAIKFLGTSSAVANWNFKVDKSPNPTAHIDRIIGIYRKMEQVLFFAGRPGTPFRLFQWSPHHPDPKQSGVPAYTSLGGMERGLAEKDEFNEYKNAIYITPEFANKVFAASIIIHELAHYCGGSERNIDSIEHRASPFPHPNGVHLEDGFRSYARMTPDEAFRNAQSYQAFCEPNRVGMPPK
ncbi:peptidoglycan-binding domain-containing protein [Reyranella sp.]|uniref:peptidoglycan-binding domain-containing protein n=1 Tax=Reyranella sp. TaxID=1929291 RepID=UPI003D0D1750